MLAVFVFVHLGGDGFRIGPHYVDQADLPLCPEC